jgi:aminoglycoside phosphotransferase (APT) family kinase protein
MSEPTLEALRSAIVSSFPSLARSSFRLLAKGWHSTAVEVDGRLVFKFPRDEIAERALLKEAALLTVVRPHVALPVPAMRIHNGPPIFSSHEKLEGEHLLAAAYHKLPEGARQRLGEDLARFYAELHELDTERMTAAGADAVTAWQSPDSVASKAIPSLPPALRDRAEQTVLEFARLPPDPHGTTYGFFDGHGWNMAFDHARGRLNGIYDFADSGIGPLHQEFIYSNFISSDLTERITAAYESRTGRALDRRRIDILTGFHRLSELAELADDQEHAPAMTRHVAEWFATTDGSGDRSAGESVLN